MKIVITGTTSGVCRQPAIDFHREENEVWALGRNDQAVQDMRSMGINTEILDLINRKPCDYISNGLAKIKGEIHFSKRLTFFLRLLSLLPIPLWALIGQKKVRK